MKQKTWFTLHYWAGFHFSLLLSFVLLMGTLATISTELDWLTNPAIRAEHQVSEKQLIDWPALLQAVNQDYPKDKIERINRPSMPWHNIEVIARDQENQRFRIYLDAVNHNITGEGKWHNFQRFIRESHRHLKLPLPIGISIVGSLSIAMLLLFISSLFIYSHWWKYFFTFERIKTSFKLARIKTQPINLRKEASTKRRFWAELHKFIGLWCLWFVLLVSITGAWYLAERWGAGVRYPAIKNSVNHNQSGNLDVQPTKALSRAIDYMQINHPEFTINQVRFVAAKNIIEIHGQEDAILVRDRANKKVFDNLTGEFIGGHNGSELDWHFRISEAADPLHFGAFSSWHYRYVWFAFGLALSFLSFSGIYMYFLRLRQTGALKLLEGRNSLYVLWLNSFWIKWPCLGLLCAWCYFAIRDLIFLP
ncbi:PepSY-associated TM helix domain-containing protein [Paraglaciecola sp. 2405UD69-4]|uniref:PepSY-associated TM helix domain-containing protein n=1 Tax=Paraglaciecola sp. 2405UD69-4 TaxID=3391836 RepID=UPI0039C9A99A